MKKCLVMTASFVLLGHSLALAQDSTRNLPPAALRQQPPAAGAGNLPAAPVGHRQPTASTVPSETGKNDPGKIDAQDRELDRMIKNICKGC
jgi:hypothetical protein